MGYFLTGVVGSLISYRRSCGKLDALVGFLRHLVGTSLSSTSVAGGKQRRMKGSRGAKGALRARKFFLFLFLYFFISTVSVPMAVSRPTAEVRGCGGDAIRPAVPRLLVVCGAHEGTRGRQCRGLTTQPGQQMRLLRRSKPWTPTQNRTQQIISCVRFWVGVFNTFFFWK